LAQKHRKNIHDSFYVSLLTLTCIQICSSDLKEYFKLVLYANTFNVGDVFQHITPTTQTNNQFFYRIRNLTHYCALKKVQANTAHCSNTNNKLTVRAPPSSGEGDQKVEFRDQVVEWVSEESPPNCQ